jgi:hypothetical protein
MIRLYEVSKLVRVIDTGRKVVIARGWEEGKRECYLVSVEFQFFNERFWRYVSYQCKYT